MAFPSYVRKAATHLDSSVSSNPEASNTGLESQFFRLLFSFSWTSGQPRRAPGGLLITSVIGKIEVTIFRQMLITIDLSIKESVYRPSL